MYIYKKNNETQYQKTLTPAIQLEKETCGVCVRGYRRSK